MAVGACRLAQALALRVADNVGRDRRNTSHRKAERARHGLVQIQRRAAFDRRVM